MSPGSTYIYTLTLTDWDGPVDADATPPVTLLRNCSTTATTVIVTHSATGIYTISATIPGSWSDGDWVQFLSQPVVGGVTYLDTSPAEQLSSASSLTPEVLADAVGEELLANHTTVGTFGWALATAAAGAAPSCGTSSCDCTSALGTYQL